MCASDTDLTRKPDVRSTTPAFVGWWLQPLLYFFSVKRKQSTSWNETILLEALIHALILPSLFSLIYLETFTIVKKMSSVQRALINITDFLERNELTCTALWARLTVCNHLLINSIAWPGQLKMPCVPVWPADERSRDYVILWTTRVACKVNALDNIGSSLSERVLYAAVAAFLVSLAEVFRFQAG